MAVTLRGTTIRNETAVEAWSPIVLFANNEPGAWYDPTDIPVNWRRNLLTYTEQFDNAAWLQSRVTVSVNAEVAPDGTTTAEKMIATAVSGTHREFQFFSKSATPITFTFSCYLKAAEYSFALLRLADSTETDSASCCVNLATGEILVGASGFTGQSGSAVSVGSGWWRVSITATTDSETTVSSMVFIQTSLAVSASSFTGNGSDGIFVWGAQLERGTTVTDYQQIVTPAISFLTYQPQPVMFQESTGQTPVWGVEQAVGLVLDKSRGLVLGPELISSGVVGLVGTATAATYNTTTGAGTATRVDINNQSFVSWTGLPNSTTYRLTISCSSGSTFVRVGGSPGSIVAQVASGNTVTVYVNPVSNDITLTAATPSGSTAFTVVSFRALAGTHRIQPGATNRLILRARYNQLLYTEDFSNAIWVTGTGGTGVSAVKTPNFGIAPDGTQTACRVQLDKGAGTTDGDFARMFQSSSVTSSVRRIWIKTNDASTKTFRLEAAGSNITVTGTWTQISDAASASSLQVLLQGTTSTTADFLVWHPELVRSSDTYLPYQRVNAATDYDTVGFPVYLSYDGSDDGMYTGGNLDMSSTDKVTVFTGVTKLSDALTGVFLEFSADAGANNGTWAVYAPGAAAAPRLDATSRGTVARGAGVNSAPYAAPITTALTAIGNISGELTEMRLDGVSVNSNTGDQGTGNYGSYPAYFGRRNNASLRFNGREYQTLIVGRLCTADETTRTERYVAVTQGRNL